MNKEIEVSPAQAARTLGVTLNYIYVLLWTKRLPARKSGGRWLIPSSAVESRLRDREARCAAVSS
jgi:excisionase family DNA binding protein